MLLGGAAPGVAGLNLSVSAQAPAAPWTVEWYNSMDLTGSPVLTDTVEAIEFYWGAGSPYPGTVNENFISARFTSTQTFEAGATLFSLGSDDGARLIIDGVTVLDRFYNRPHTYYYHLQTLTAGDHALTVEYYDHSGFASLSLSWALHTSGSVSGRLTGTDGLPVGRMGVGVWDGVTLLSTCSDDEGYYNLYPALNMTFKVVAGSVVDGCSQMSGYFLQWWDGKTTQDEADSITLTEGDRDRTGINFTLTRAGTITGHVYESDGTTSIATGWVDAELLGAGIHTGVGINPDGSYTLGGLAPGDYRLSASSDGYVFEYYDEAGTDADNATTVTIASGATVSGVDFTLDRGGTITGHIYESDGTTAITSNVWVNVEPLFNGHYPGAEVEADGSYTIRGIEPGDYRVRAVGDGYAFEFYDEAGQNGENATAVTVLAGATVSGVDFALDPGGSISGTITAGDGTTSLANMAVNIDGMWAGSCTDGDGHYTISNLPLDLPLYVTAGGSGPFCGGDLGYLFEYWENASNWQEATSIILTPAIANRTNIDFALELGGTITGYVYQSDGITPITANVAVNAEPVFNGQGAGAGVQADGSYAISGIAPGEYRVRAQADGYAFEFYDEAGTDGQNATTLVVTSGGVIPNIDFTLDPGGSISGTITADGSGAPLANMKVNIDNVWAGTCTDADGHYSLTNLPLNMPLYLNTGGGDNWCGGSDDYIFEYWDDARAWSEATPLTLIPGNANRAGIDYSLTLGGTISGRVTEANGVTPVTSGYIYADAFDGTANVGYGASLQPDGTYQITGVPAGTYRARADAPGYAFEFYLDAGYYAESATPISVTVGVETPNVDFTLDPGGTISGVVTAEDGVTPLPNISIAIEGLWLGRCTDANGQYAVYTVPLNIPLKVVAESSNASNPCGQPPHEYAGEWWQETGDPNLAHAITLTLAQRERTDIDFTLELGGTVSGVVTDQNTGLPLANVNVNVHYDTYAFGGCTNADGTYVIHGVPKDLDFIVGAATMDWCGEGRYMRELWEETPNSDEAIHFTLTDAAPALTDIDFTLELGGHIAGTVTAAESGDPLEGIPVCAFPYNVTSFSDTPPWTCAQTEADGTYQIWWNRVGDYRIWLFPEDRLRLFYNNSPTFAGATPVAVTAGSITPGIDFSLPLAAIISGTVTDTNGQPMNGVTVSLADGTYPECSQSDGSYRIWVPGGEHIVKAGAGMCNSEIDFPTQYYQWVTAEGDATPVNAVVGQTTPDIDFTLQVRLLGEVILQGHGTPPDPRWAQDLSVSVTLPEPAPSIPFNVTTDENGAFSLNGLEIGPQRIWIKGAHTLANAADVVLHYGDNPVQLGLLREGDANDSNGVTITDFSLLAASFSMAAGDAGYDARADFNDDGVVNISDFSLLASNFTLSGAAP